MSTFTTIRNAALVLLVAGTCCAGFAQAAPKPKPNSAKPQATAPKPQPKPLPDARWMLDYPQQEDSSYSESNVERDPKYLPFLKAYLTQEAYFSAGPRPLWKVADEFLNVGTGRVKIYDQRYATISGCVAHMCNLLQGFLWVDTASKVPRVFFAAITVMQDEGATADQAPAYLWIFANQTLNDDADANLEKLPAEFLNPLADWLGKGEPTSVMFVGHVGEMIPLLPSYLHP